MKYDCIRIFVFAKIVTWCHCKSRLPGYWTWSSFLFPSKGWPLSTSSPLHVYKINIHFSWQFLHQSNAIEIVIYGLLYAVDINLFIIDHFNYFFFLETRGSILNQIIKICSDTCIKNILGIFLNVSSLNTSKISFRGTCSSSAA